MAVNASYWERLPFKILNQVFSYLHVSDRHSASLTCKLWYSVLNSPLLWRQLKCVFSLDEPSKVRWGSSYCHGFSCIRVVLHCAPWLRRLHVEPFDDDEFGIDEMSVRPMVSTFFKSLLAAPEILQLEELQLIGYIYSDVETDSLEDLILSTARFLRSQTKLKVFCLNWHLPKIYALLLLDALNSSLTSLKMEECLSVDVVRTPETLRKYFSYKNLNRLHLRYEDLGAENLLQLARTCKNLRILRISVGGEPFESITEEPVVIPSHVWNTVTNNLPKLKVAFDLGYYHWNPQLLNVTIPYEVPLVWLYFDMKRAIPHSCLQYLKAGFAGSLEMIELDGVIGNEVISCVSNFLMACSNLKSLKIFADASLNIIQDLMEFRINSLIVPEYLVIVFLALTEEEEMNLIQINKHYQALRLNFLFKFISIFADNATLLRIYEDYKFPI